MTHHLDAAGAVCPFTGRQSALPLDGNPHVPAPAFADARMHGPVAAVQFADGHDGLITTQYDIARAVLEDPRFSQVPRRLLLGPAEPARLDLDAAAHEALALADILSLDGEQHLRIRRSITSRFSVKAVRGRRDVVGRYVTEALDAFLEGPNPGNVTEYFAAPITVLTHCFALGVPAELVPLFEQSFVHESTSQQKFSAVREFIRAVSSSRGENVISDLLASDLTATEVEGIVFVLAVSGRDSVAYMIAMSVLTLLQHPEQLKLLVREPDLMPSAIEELVRFNTMFVTVFTRTATESLELAGVSISEGQSVAVSTVAANRDPARFDNPSVFDITRDAAGHLGFSHGPHGCVGQQFARVQVTEALTQQFQRVPNLELMPTEFESPFPLASFLPTYEAPPVMVTW